MATHHTGESSSSQEPRTVNQRADAHFPGAYVLPPPPILLPIMHVGAERGTSSAAPTTAAALPLLLPFGGDAGSPVAGVDPLVFVDSAASPEPLAVVPPGPFFGLDDDYVHAGRALHRDLSGVRFDDLPPETFDFFEHPLLPPPPPPSPFGDW